MPLLLLIRHGENDFVKTGKLPGQSAGIHLNERGQKQAQTLGDALKEVPIKAIYSSPLERAMETAEPIATSHQLEIIQEQHLMDADVGKWQGKSLKVLRLTNAWKVVQHAPPVSNFRKASPFLTFKRGSQTRLKIL